jgi:hypothetical protein
MPSFRTRYQQLEGWSPVLARTSVICLMLFGVALIGLLLDHREITGVPAWLKPAKFGASGVIYLVTLAWLAREIPRTRLLRAATWLIGWILVAEIIVIDVQSARGTTSHFNVDSPLDIALFSAMGIGIAAVWVMSMVLLWLHLRTPAADRSMALALRIGLALNILGAGVGWTMTQPRPAQLAAMKRGERPFIAGSHTIGAADGGPGIPLTHWSRDHGDLRIPHFLGMHALQLLPLLLLGIRRLRTRRDDGVESTVILFAGSVCAIIFVAALTQALAGHPLIPLSTS